MTTKHLYTGLATLAISATALAQSDCSQIIQAAFTSTVQGNTVVLSNTSQSQFPQATTYQWVFGDGEVASGSTVTHVFDAPGTYSICLYGIVENCVDTICHDVLIGGENPCDGLSAEFSNTISGSDVQFDNAVSSNQYSYLWYFGDGTEGFGPDPAHNYPGPGTYAVCLVMWSWEPFTQDTCWADNCESIVIEGGGDPCAGLTAGFSPNVVSGGVQFSNTTTGTGFQTTWNWSFGDGASSDGAQPLHEYDQPGQYMVCLTAISIYEQQGGGVITCLDSICQQVTSQGQGSPCDSLQACFQWSGQNSTIQFYNCTYGGGSNLNYMWHFGDGTMSDAPTPAHSFPEPGTYTVCLTAWLPNSPDSCSSTICNVVVVDGGGSSPCDSLSADFIFTIQENLAAFNSFGGTAIGYHWTFGDGTVGDGPGPVHTYPGPGTYHACLTTWAWNSFTLDTCYADHCEWITIGPGSGCDSLLACFQWGTQQDVTQFSNCSSFNTGELYYSWSFGDGTYSDAYQPAHEYPGPGTYTVCLTAYAAGSPDSCSSTICNTLTIQGGGSACDSLLADFVVTTQETLAAFSALGGTAIGYHWNFGDGTEGDGAAPVHTYPDPGTYHACLVTWTWNSFTQDTCYAEHCEWIIIGGGDPCDGLDASFLANVGDVTVFFSNTTIGTGLQTTWHWDFGDGTSGNDAEPSHIFPGLSTYEVCLTVSSIYEQQGGGVITCQDSVCLPVFTGNSSPCDSLQAHFTQEPGGQGLFFFQNVSATGGQDVLYFWSFGDGGSSDDSSPAHTFPGPGQYVVCLTITAPNAPDTCTSMTCATITVLGGVTACDSLWSASFEYGNQGNAFTFYNTSDTQGSEVSTQWTFGDGTYGNGSQLIHTYTASGNYTVCMTITGIIPGTIDSCHVEICQLIELSVGVADVSSATPISVWPIPFDGALRLEGSVLQGNTRYTLFDMTGRIVDDRSLLSQGSMTLEYANLPSGTYLLRLRNAIVDHSLLVIGR